MKVAILAGLLAMGLSACGQAGVTIEEARYRPPLGSTQVGVAYFTIRSGKADRIVQVSSPDAVAVEIHTSVTEDGRSSMEQLDGVDLPAGQKVRFEPGGLHLMVISPQESSASGAFPITFRLESGLETTASFRLIGQARAPGG